MFCAAFCLFCGYPRVATQILMCMTGQRAGIRDSGGRNEANLYYKHLATGFRHPGEWDLLWVF